VNPKDYDLIALAMQEPQYRSPGVRELLDAVAKSRVPCMSIMNMPPLPYEADSGLNYDALKSAYAIRVWDNFDPGCLTLCSPDPQAIRPPDEKVNVLMVTLPTNFKVAKFDNDKSTAILRQLEQEIDAVRFDPGDGVKIELPVKLRVHDSIFVPLAKWSMLLAGNYRCVTGAECAPRKKRCIAISRPRARSTISCSTCASSLAPSPAISCRSKYADAAKSLIRPASAARARKTARPISNARTSWCSSSPSRRLSHPVIDAGVALVDARLEANRKRRLRPNARPRPSWFCGFLPPHGGRVSQIHFIGSIFLGA
jgi:hypothetical protein